MRPRTTFALAVLAALGASTVHAQALDDIHDTPTVTSTTTTTYYYSEPPVTTTYYRPVVTEVYEAPPRIVVEAEPIGVDEAITYDVVDTLAADDRLSGRIGVETYDRRVELSGIVTTPGQARIAARDAMSVPGVREVNSQLRTRVGGSRY